jgi:hypothetical protein
MSLSPATFRRAAFGLSTAAAMSVFALASFPAAAQQASTAYNGTPACAPFKGSDRAIKCEIEQSDLRIKASQERTEESRLRGIQALDVTKCVQFLTEGVKSGTLAKAEILERASGKLNDANACPIAVHYGFGRKAEMPAPKG